MCATMQRRFGDVAASRDKTLAMWVPVHRTGSVILHLDKSGSLFLANLTSLARLSRGGATKHTIATI
jgi:hypothetical protein